MPNYAIAIHGGAGNILRSKLKPELQEKISEALTQALEKAKNILANQGSALDAVTKAVQCLEDAPYFNAGVGSVFTHAETHEMDASIMDGNSKQAGAVAGIQRVKNPILLSRKIMEASDYVFLIGKGAEEFATDHQLALVEDQYFSTSHRRKQLDKIQSTGGAQLDHDVDADEDKMGTVGAVAVDHRGHVAAATSSGGLTNKRYGRVGDSAVIGAGTYADNQSCAVSCTGTGEHFIRLSAAHKVSDLIKYLDLTTSEACHKLIHEKLPAIGGKGGLIAVDPFGNIEMPFNTPGMFRGYFREKDGIHVELFEDNNQGSIPRVERNGRY